MRFKNNMRLSARTMAPVISLLVLIVASAIVVPGFLKLTVVDGHIYGSLIDILHRATPTILVAVGMAVVISTKGIDLSVGAIIAICGAVTAVLTTTTELSPVIVMGCALLAGMACGLWNGTLVSVFGIQPIVATLILMVAGRGIAQMITGGQIVTFHSDFFNAIGNGFFMGLPARVVLAATIIAITLLALRKTALGVFLEAVGGNAESSRLMGIDSRLLILMAYVFSGFCAALAGIIIAADIRGADANNAGLWLELDAILAVVIAGASLSGGRIYLGLTVIGALIIQTLTTAILTSGLPAQYNLIVKASIIVVVLLMQSPITQRFLKERMQSFRRSSDA